MSQDARTLLEGPIAHAMGQRYEPRPQQVELARAVEAALGARATLVAEAGTGTGKSFAYLVPAFLRAARGEVVVVATNTIALQEQLFDRDIPLLLGALRESTETEVAAIADAVRP